MYNEVKETRTLKLEISVNFNPLTSEHRKKSIWLDIVQAVNDEKPFDSIEGYDDDFYIEDLKCKDNE